MGMNNRQLTELQARGLRWQQKDALGLTRVGGAGPTDHKALQFESQTTMVPVYNRQVDNSPYVAISDPDSEQVLIFEDDKLVDSARVPKRPKFYDLTTEDGIPYWQIATLHSHNVLATTVLQTCVRYRNRETSCQFCAIEESLKARKTIAHKRPHQLAEVARAAVELDGVTQMILTTGTPKGTDRGAEVLVESARAIRQVVDIPIQAQCEPPDDDKWLLRMKLAGIDAVGMHLEAASERVRRKIMPGKASVPLSRYMSAFRTAVAVFGAGNVSTYILAGLGDTEKEIIDLAEKLIFMGVYPFVVPFVPVAGTPLENQPMADPAMLDRIYSVLGPQLVERGIASENLKAGCAKCGACSALPTYEKSAQQLAAAGGEVARGNASLCL